VIPRFGQHVTIIAARTRRVDSHAMTTPGARGVRASTCADGGYSEVEVAIQAVNPKWVYRTPRPSACAYEPKPHERKRTPGRKRRK
jgi:hypothetical protein